MVLNIDTMHDDQWTQRAVMGWESQLGELARTLETGGAWLTLRSGTLAAT
jgi:hypothetical protein